MPSTRDGHYSTSGWNYIFKKWWIKQKIRKQRQNRPPVTPAYEGSVPNADDAIRPEEHLFFGCDHEGNLLLINEHITQSAGEVYLYLKLKDGRTFTLPEHPITTIKNSLLAQNKIPGLNVECLTPYNKWRITFNGLLKNPLSEDENDLQHVVLTFFWTAASDPLDLPYSMSPSLVAAAIAKETGKLDDLLEQLSLKFQGHDQFGSLFGQITIDGQTPSDRQIVELNLPGVRQRRWSDISKEMVHRMVTFIGVCEDGNVFVLGAKSFREQLTHIPFGFIRKANGQFFSIDATDFHLSGFAEENSTMPRAGTIMFEANNEDYLVTVHFHNTPGHSILEGRPLLWKTNITTAAISLDRSFGQGICLSGYPIKESEKRRTSQPEPLWTSPVVHMPTGIETDPCQLFLSFSEPECRTEFLCGGKGASLGILHYLAQQKTQSRYQKFVIPNGFVLTINAFKLQLERCEGLRKAIKVVDDVAANRIDGNLETVCKNAYELFKNIEIEPEIVRAILCMYDVLQENYINQGNNDEGRHPFRVAVRSSAIGEDSVEASAAGQNDSYLGCHTTTGVLDALKNCWASLYSYQSVFYRKQNLQPICTQMAVVIQTMVPAECAGVMFTRHPGDNDAYKLLISANYGLGESVVSGKVDPDNYTIRRSYKRDQLHIAKKEVGEKATSIYMSQTDGKVDESETSEDDRKKFCLSDEQIIQLCKIGLFLERFHENERDIEWAIYKNSFYLLQSRPMTSVNSFTSWELLHEFDTAIMSPEDVSTFGNIGEVLPEVLTPLTQSTFGRILDRSMTRIVMLREPSPFYAGLTRSSHYRMAFEVCNMFLSAVEKKITLENKMHGIIVFGHDFITDDIHRIALHRNGPATVKKTWPIIWNLLKDLFLNSRKCEALQKFTETFIGTYDPMNLSKFKSAADLFVNLKFNVEKMSYPALVHGSTSKSSLFYQIIALTILAEHNTDLTIEHSADIALMLSSCKDIESAEIPQQLALISQELRTTKNDEEFSRIKSKTGIEWLEKNCPTAYELLKEFLQKHSHRTYKEFELESKTWGMCPEIVIEMLQMLTRLKEAPANIKPREVDKSNAQIAAELTAPKRAFTRKCIKWILPYCKNSVQIREKSKSNFIAYIHEIRKGFRHLAHLMNREGLLPAEDIIFYLTQTEIESILNRHPGNILAKAARRKRLFSEWRKNRFDEMQFGNIRPIREEAIVSSEDSKYIRIMGTPVCQGIVTGRACVLKSFDEVSKIQPGDILVTNGTDIGWSPYFPILTGVITELGGLISHGAVVAREYGLPCIVGASGATTDIQFGEKIQMDANTGIIIKVK